MNADLPMKPVFHGGGLDRAVTLWGGHRSEWLDLSTGINPRAWPVPPVSAEAWQRLPDHAAIAWLGSVARKYYEVPPGMTIVPAPGTQALIEALPRLLPGMTATILAPPVGTYREHAHCAAKAGRKVREAAGFSDVLIDETLVTVVNPNNPDGSFWGRSTLLALASRLQLREGFLIVDEAFCDTAPRESIVAELPRNAIVLRSFGKFFGLAGLRLGFAICDRAIAARIADHFGPWAVSGPAIEIGVKALSDDPWIGQTRAWLDSQSQALADLLAKSGLYIDGRHPLFLLVRHPRAIHIHDGLARSKILVRHFPDREGLLRFGIPASAADLDRLNAALQRITGR